MSRARKEKELKRLFLRGVPKARWCNPFFRRQYELMYSIYSDRTESERLLNIFSSRDLSGKRSDTFRNSFFNGYIYHELDFWQDAFKGNEEGSYDTEYADGYFDKIVTTKVILEHVSCPASLMKELSRISGMGGRLYLIAPHIRRQHQKPYDYMRFTECAIRKLAIDAGFRVVSIKNCGGFLAMVGYYFYFVQRGLKLPKCIERFADIAVYWIVEPLFYFLDNMDNGYGRDMTMYFTVILEKERVE